MPTKRRRRVRLDISPTLVVAEESKNEEGNSKEQDLSESDTPGRKKKSKDSNIEEEVINGQADASDRSEAAEETGEADPRKESKSIESSMTVKEKKVTARNKKTRTDLETQVNQLLEENASLKRQLAELNGVRRNPADQGKGGNAMSASDRGKGGNAQMEGNGLCGSCATYLLELQRQVTGQVSQRAGDVGHSTPQPTRGIDEIGDAGSRLQTSDETETVPKRRVSGAVTVPKKRDEKLTGWTTVKGRRSHPTTQGKAIPVHTSNRYAVLADAEKDEVRYLVVGDSRVRPLKKAFCKEEDRCVVIPGASVSDIGVTVQEELNKCDPDVVIVHVGVNDVGSRRSVKLTQDYHSLLRNLREARKPVIVTGILPRMSASREWYSRALAANVSVEKLCSNMGFKFVDLWEEFYGQGIYYIRDGLHFSDRGASVLAEAYTNVLPGN